MTCRPASSKDGQPGAPISLLMSGEFVTSIRDGTGNNWKFLDFCAAAMPTKPDGSRPAPLVGRGTNTDITR